MLEEKLARVMALAFKCNNITDYIQRLSASGKPNIFVRFSGHVNLFEVSIYKRGWYENAEADHMYSFYLASPDAERKLDEIINLLEVFNNES